jgi:Pentatricopeptide repeat domain
VIDCLGRTGSKEYAQTADKLMNELKDGCNDKISDNRFSPTIFLFTTLLRTWGRVDTPEAIVRCHEILDESIEWAGPHVNVFTCLIQVLTKSTCAEQPAQTALQLLQRMRSLSVEPTIVTYNAALEACGKQRDKGAATALKIAFAIFKAVEQPSSPVSPTEWTYTALLGCVAGLLPASDERNKIATTVFRKAAAKQMVSKRMLFLLNRACDSNVFYDLLCHDMMPTTNKKFDFDNIPTKWSKHSGAK